MKAPRVNDKRVDKATGERKRFSSAILPPWAPKTPKNSEVLPLLYLHGVSSGDFVPALEQFLGSSAGLSPATITRLTAQWQADHGVHGPRSVRHGLRLRLGKYPKVVKRITDDEEELFAFFDFLAEHWIHLRTTNPIESAFATVRLRTTGAGSRAAALAMVFKLIESAQERWRAVNAPHLVALVRAGARFERVVLVERSEARAA